MICQVDLPRVFEVTRSCPEARLALGLLVGDQTWSETFEVTALSCMYAWGLGCLAIHCFYVSKSCLNDLRY